jgi:adenylate cyclase
LSFLNELKRRNVLRVAAAYVVTSWLIVQVVETLFPIYGLSDAVLRTAVNVLAIGLLPVLILSWIFELTPDGLRKDQEVDHQASSTLQNAKRLDRIILLVLALALGYFAFDKFVLDPARDVEIAEDARQEGRTEAMVESYGDNSIAVLPFTNMSSDPEQEYFGDGLAEEILNLLAGIPELRVISRSSAFTFKGSDLPIPEIADQLNVAHILEGSVRKAGNQIRVTAQLIEARTDTHIWSQTWDRTLEDIFVIQDEVAKEVVDKLHLTLFDPVPTAVQTDPGIYVLFLQAKQLIESRNEESILRAIELIDKVLSVDPDYVPALEIAFWLDYQKLDFGIFTPEDYDLVWQERRNHVLSLDPDNSIALGYAAWGSYVDDRNFELAAQTYEGLVKLNPNDAELLRVAGGFLRRIGKFDPAIQLFNRCLKIDPLKNSCLWQLKEAYFWSGAIETAQIHSDRLTLIWGTSPRVHDILMLLMLGETERAKSLVETWEADDVHYAGLMGIAWHDLGHMKLQEEFFNDMVENFGTEDPFEVAMMFAYLGKNDDAFYWLNKVMETDESIVVRGLLNPFYWKLYDDPRWIELRERLKMSPERLDAIEFEVYLPD